MNEKHIRVLRVFFIFLVILFLCGAGATAGVKGDIELVGMLAEGFKANRQKIGTWKGTATVTSRRSDSVIKDPFDFIVTEKSITFACDANLNARRWNLKVLEDRRVKEGTQEVRRNAYFANGLIKNGLMWRVGPLTRARDSHPYSCRMSVPGQMGTRLVPMDIFDPFEYFKNDSNDLGEIYRIFKLWVDSDKCNIVISRDGSLVSVEHSSAPIDGRPLVNRYTYDLSKGGGMVAYYSTDPDPDKGPLQVSYEYQEVGGAWVPTKVVWDFAGKADSYHVEVAFDQNVVNEPIDPSEFTLATIGLQDGDIVYDQRTDTDLSIRNQR
ncbi:MAG: hypothetical protein J7M19_08940 [Planctomycetes bacterium]|nr:hypothetical protein [Planctomycetota bacterium]